MTLYEGHFEERNGEYEYTIKEYVVAESLDEAGKYFDEMLLEWFGDETKVEELDDDGNPRWVEVAWGYPACKIDYITATSGFSVRSVDGKIYRVNYEIEEVTSE